VGQGRTAPDSIFGPPNLSQIWGKMGANGLSADRGPGWGLPLEGDFGPAAPALTKLNRWERFGAAPGDALSTLRHKCIHLF
jgi:hypothetical protein